MYISFFLSNRFGTYLFFGIEIYHFFSTPPISSYLQDLIRTPLTKITLLCNGVFARKTQDINRISLFPFLGKIKKDKTGVINDPLGRQ